MNAIKLSIDELILKEQTFTAKLNAGQEKIFYIEEKKRRCADRFLIKIVLFCQMLTTELSNPSIIGKNIWCIQTMWSIVLLVILYQNYYDCLQICGVSQTRRWAQSRILFSNFSRNHSTNKSLKQISQYTTKKKLLQTSSLLNFFQVLEL